MRTNYIGHDLAYQRRRAAGEIGWGSAEDLAEHFASLEKVLARPEFPRAGRLLELGCGAGNVTIWFGAKGYSVSGVDIAPTAIAWARDNAAAAGIAADFAVGDVVTLAGNDELDVVVDGHCFHCIIGADRGAFLANAFRLLKPGGAFCLHTMCGDPTNDAIREQFDPATRCLMRGDLATRYLGLPEAIIDEVLAAGFRIIFREVEIHPAADQSMLLLLAVK
jgi:SAM-dependent methyltransferase